MDNGSSHLNDESQKELSISLAASSMINASDMIAPGAYQANLKRIQEAKEMVRRLEFNNEAAHKNYIVDQLEKRAKEGREAEDMLARLRTQSGLSEVVQNVTGNRSEAILPTTASVVEVPESQISPPRPSSTATVPPHSSQTVQQGRPAPANYQWTSSPQVLPYYPVPQYNAARHPQATIDAGQVNRYATQSMPPQSGVYNQPIYQTGYHAQQPLQPWSGYPYHVVALPGTTSTSAQGLNTPTASWIRTTPMHGDPNVGSNSMHRESRFPTESTTSRPQSITHNQSQNPTLYTPTSHVHMSPQSVPAVPTQGIPVSKVPPPQKPSQQPQHYSKQSPAQPQQVLQPPPRSQQHAQQSHPHQQPPQTHLPGPLQSTDYSPSTNISRPSNQLTQPPQPSIAQEQTRQQGEHPYADQATFIRHFQNVVQRGMLHSKAFWLKAKAAGISDEWFAAAIRSLPRGVLQSVMAQIPQAESTADPVIQASAPRQQVSTISGSNVPVAIVHPPPTVVSLVEMTPVAQEANTVSTPTDDNATNPSLGRTSGAYAAQLQYYAEQATRSSLAPVGSSSTIPTGNTTSIQAAVVTPRRDVPQGHAAVRMPKDANKSTLAQDILRSLGRTLPQFVPGTGAEPMDKIDNHDDNQKPEETPLQPVSATSSIPFVVPPTTDPDITCSPLAPLAEPSIQDDREGNRQPEETLLQLVSPMASSAPPAVPPPTDLDLIQSSSTPLAKSNVQDEPQHVASPNLRGARSVLQEEYGQAAAVEGPVVIDLTVEESDESAGGKGQESTFPIPTITDPATSSQPVSSINTTSHTLMENLSSEQSSVDVAAGGSPLDVRMNSQPLPPATGTSTEFNFLPSQPGNAGSGPSNVEMLPHGVTEGQLDSPLPLFLPSPPISLAPTEPPETDLEMIFDEGERPALKRRFIDVDEMEIDREVVTSRTTKRPKQRAYVLIPSPPLYVRKAMMEVKGHAMGEGRDEELEGDEEPQYSHLERLLVEESKSRLLERRCRWMNCASVLNCAANLLAHLKIHIHEEDLQVPFHCRWATCHKRIHTEQGCNVHLERHATRPFPCPVAGCNEQFDKPVEVMQHEVQHQKADRGEPLVRKPTREPTVPAIPARLGLPPRQLPSHRVIPRRVLKCRISADRHATLGPWILWNIFSPVEPDMRKQNASMRGRPTRQAISYETGGADARRDDYDFLLALSSYPTKSRQLDDLDSALITMSAARGLTLWGSDSHVNLVTESEEIRNAVPAAVAVEAAVPSATTNSIFERQQSGQSTGTGEEEDTVEEMMSYD